MKPKHLKIAKCCYICKFFECNEHDEYICTKHDFLIDSGEEVHICHDYENDVGTEDI